MEKKNRVTFFFPPHSSDKFCKPFNLVWRQIFTYVSIYDIGKYDLNHFSCDSTNPHTSISINCTIIYWILTLIRGGKHVYPVVNYLSIPDICHLFAILWLTYIWGNILYSMLHCTQVFQLFISLPFSFLLLLNPWTDHLKKIYFKVLNLFFDLPPV